MSLWLTLFDFDCYTHLLLLLQPCPLVQIQTPLVPKYQRWQININQTPGFKNSPSQTHGWCHGGLPLYSYKNLRLFEQKTQTGQQWISSSQNFESFLPHGLCRHLSQIHLSPQVFIVVTTFKEARTPGVEFSCCHGVHPFLYWCYFECPKKPSDA